MLKKFLRAVLPPQGIYFAFTKTPLPRHYAVRSPDQLANKIEALQAADHDIYFALSSFKAPFVIKNEKRRRRTHENVAHTKAFWLDVDCKNSTINYPSSQVAFDEIEAFGAEYDLPPTFIVSSGSGLHVYWALRQALPFNVWSQLASRFDAVCTAAGILFDHACTCDASRVLRPPGTLHQTHKTRIRILHCNPVAYDVLDIGKTLKRLSRTLHCTTTPPRRQGSAGLIEDLTSFPQNAYANRVALHCGQMSYIKASRGNVPEPLWYAMLCLIRHTLDADSVLHPWSDGHPNYTREETEQKYQHAIDAGTGPTTCARFNEINPGLCDGCRHRNKITSPIQLGQEITPAKTEGISMPRGYIRTENKQIARIIDGTPVAVCPYDLYPLRRTMDTSTQSQAAVIYCDMHADGERTFTLPTALLHKTSDFSKWALDLGIFLSAHSAKTTMSYITDYLNHLQTSAKAQNIYSQLGWKGDQEYTLGDVSYQRNAGFVDTGTQQVPAMQGFHARGSLDVWKKVAALYNSPRMEAYQFSLCAAFGAPLMRFTNEPGCLISIVSPEGGQGKTTILTGICSVWGDPADVMLHSRDTDNTMLQRMGVYSNMPVCIDEFTNLEGMKLSDFTYSITMGRERRRLTSQAKERAIQSQWETLVITTANRSFYARLNDHKTNSDAEILRVFEYNVSVPAHLSKAQADRLFPLWHEHYGVAGREYMKYVVDHAEAVKKLVRDVRQRLDTQLKFETRERYWSAACSAVIAGALIARRIGLIDYNIDAILLWLRLRMFAIRSRMITAHKTCDGLLALYLNECIDQCLRVQKHDKTYVVITRPQRRLTWRDDLYTDRIYIDRQDFITWLTKQHIDGEATIEALIFEKIIIAVRGYRLGAHTEYVSPSLPCIIIDRKHEVFAQPELKAVTEVVEADARNSV